MGALLELDHITKRFGQVTIAEDLSLVVQPGDAIGIVGPNGAGKTSLFGVIGGDLAPDRGEIRFDGATITPLDPALRCRLGHRADVPGPAAVRGHDRVRERPPRRAAGSGIRGEASYELAASVLDDTGLRSDANRPSGQLGLLQRKRLELARALATRPRLLLLDEVAGGLTDPEVVELVDVVRHAREEGTAVIWIEHVVRALVETVDRLICLAGGRFVGDGDPAEVLASPAVKEVFLGTEATAESLAEAGLEAERPGSEPEPAG